MLFVSELATPKICRLSQDNERKRVNLNSGLQTAAVS